MKKLMFAAAIAASAAAFADPINSIGFAGYDLGATFTNGQAEKDESGDDKEAATYGYFCFLGADSNSSVVTNETIVHDKHTPAFATADDNQFLALDTEGGTLWRSIDTLSRYPNPEGEGYVYSNGTARAVAETGTYLDTLVQFTVTEDEEPSVGNDDKLAIWLGIVTNSVPNTTNLMVKARAVINDNGELDYRTFVLDANINPGQWYRLTVKALADITDNQGIPGFQIFLNGNTTPLSATTAVIDSGYLSLIDGDSHYADLAANRSFPSRSTATTLQGVGFQGTGAVDEIVWTEDDLFPAGPTGIEFTLTWGEGVSAVSYTFGDFSTTNTMTSGTAVQLPVGDGTAQIELIPTFTSGYVFDKVTMGETDLTLTFAIPSVSTNATLLAKAAAAEDWVDDPTKDITPGDTAATAYHGLAGSALATADAQKLTTWAKAKNIAYNDIKNDTTGTYTEAYLLNCAVADVEDEKDEFVANITIAADGTPTVTPPSGKEYNGTLQLKGSNDLSTWTNINEASTTYHFYKYELSL